MRRGGLCHPKVGASPGSCLCPGWLPAPGLALPAVRALRWVPALPRHRRGTKVAARFLLSPWSRRDRLGNPIMVRLRRRVDLGFIAVSVLNRE